MGSLVLGVLLGVVTAAALRYRARARRVEVAWREQHRELCGLRSVRVPVVGGVRSLDHAVCKVHDAAAREPMEQALDALAGRGGTPTDAAWGCTCGSWGRLPAGSSEEERAEYYQAIEDHDVVCTPGEPL